MKPLRVAPHFPYDFLPGGNKLLSLFLGLNRDAKPSTMGHVCHPSTQEVETGALPQVQSHPELYSKTLELSHLKGEKTVYAECKYD